MLNEIQHWRQIRSFFLQNQNLYWVFQILREFWDPLYKLKSSKSYGWTKCHLSFNCSCNFMFVLLLSLLSKSISFTIHITVQCRNVNDKKLRLTVNALRIQTSITMVQCCWVYYHYKWDGGSRCYFFKSINAATKSCK